MEKDTDKMVPISITLTKSDIDYLGQQSSARGIDRSSVIRMIIREWAEMKRAGVRVAFTSELPHPPDAEAVSVIYVQQDGQR